jgi:uncharacterized protein DUF6338
LADFPSLKPSDIAYLTTFFGNGFVCRYAMRKVRGLRSEADLHTITHSVVASLILWAPFTIGNAMVDGRLAVAKPYQLPCSTALYLSLSYGLGLVWGYGPWLASCTKWPWLRERFGTVESQSIRRFLKDGHQKWMRFRMEDGRTYEGMVAHYDGDPERFKDIHIVLKWPSYSADGTEFVIVEGVDQMMICVSDVKTMQILPPPPPAAVEPIPPKEGQ